MATPRDPFDALTEAWEPAIRKAFLEAVQGIVDQAGLAAIEAQIMNGDIEGAIRAVGLDPVQFRAIDAAITGAFNAGGEAFGQQIPAVRDSMTNALVRFYFDIRNQRAETWARERSSNLITEIINDQRQAIRATITSGLEAGINPRTVALDLVGRRDATTGARTGGIIGLTSQQEQWQRNYAAELASTDAQSLNAALQRGLRDKRFDGAIRKAIATGEPISAETQAKMLLAYRSRSLKYRADVIARNESIKALGAAQTEAYQQAIDKGQVRADQIIKIPVSAKDERTRFTHREVERLNKDGVGWYEYYKVPPGMAPQMHAPYDEPMCRCREKIRVNFFAGLK